MLLEGEARLTFGEVRFWDFSQFVTTRSRVVVDSVFFFSFLPSTFLNFAWSVLERERERTRGGKLEREGAEIDI